MKKLLTLSMIFVGSAMSVFADGQTYVVSGNHYISNSKTDWLYSNDTINFEEGKNTDSFIFWESSKEANISFDNGTQVNGAILVGEADETKPAYEAGKISSNPNSTNIRIGWGTVDSYNASINVLNGSIIKVGDWYQTVNGNGDIKSGKVETTILSTDATKLSKVHLNKLHMGLSSLTDSTYENNFIVGNNAQVWTTSGMDVGQYSGSGIVNVKFVGENTSAYIYGDAHIGNNSTSVAGNTNVYAKGTDTSKVNYFQNGAMNIYLSNNEGATSKASVVLDGNVIFKRPTGEYITVNIGDNSNAVAGEASFEIKNAGNDANFWNLTVYNASATGGKASLILQGAGSNVTVHSNLKVSGGKIVDGVVSGGELRFNIDDTGISTLKVNKLTFDGIITVDFTRLTTKDVYQEYTIMNVTSAFAENSITDADFNFITRDASDIVKWNLSEDNKFLYVNYTSSIPEPSTYAAIFGALALAFVAYRKRK